MDIRQLTTFQKAATLLSFSRAAAELNYSQSSVTSQIKSLETTLGVALFERLAGRSVLLTPAGQRLLPYAEQLLALADEARRAATSAPEPQSGGTPPRPLGGDRRRAAPGRPPPGSLPRQRDTAAGP
ncbi:LysR family transcriptional regulator [Kitasatospora sp. NPDC002227]|uniref:LysR family transcriptional regulator n=1 Tax=Kitasatospora sp. NPDC002227 TaxID=3154773 RepID=UPI00332CA6EA